MPDVPDQPSDVDEEACDLQAVAPPELNVQGGAIVSYHVVAPDRGVSDDSGLPSQPGGLSYLQAYPQIPLGLLLSEATLIRGSHVARYRVPATNVAYAAQFSTNGRSTRPVVSVG